MVQGNNMVIIPKSSPNWKEGLLIVLLTFCLWKIESPIFKLLSFVVLVFLGLNFLAVTFTLFFVNIFGLIKEIHVNKEYFVVINLRNEEFVFSEITSKKIPFNNLYLIELINRDGISKKVVLTQTELLCIEFLMKS
jgi:hypothetical protein